MISPGIISLSLRAGVLGLVLLSGVAAASPELVVFPFRSEDPRLGFAVADRLTQTVLAPSLPPELALGLVPPYVLQDGRFISPLTLLGQEQTASRHAAELLREGLDSEVVVTGQVRYSGEELELELFVARAQGSRAFRFRAPETAPARLVRGARAALALYTDLPLRAASPLTLDLSSPYGTFIDGLVQLGGGFPDAALPLLEQAARAQNAEPRWARRAGALRGVLANDAASLARTPLLAAVVGLNAEAFDATSVRRAFAASELPLAQLWDALLAVQEGEVEAAKRAFSSLNGADYPFAEVEQLLFELRGADAEARAESELETILERHPTSLAALVGGLFVAQTVGDNALEQDVATRLTGLASAFAYPYERLSQVAFDEDDPLLAATALTTATRLEPSSSLYWTNLGWANYLLGVLGKSESASQRAAELDENDFIARYNLGLVQVVTGRLELAATTYDEAVARDLLGDNTLDPAATDDLEGALERYPDVPGVHYALATLYEVSGDLGAAATAYTRYAELGRGELVGEAQARAASLRAPPPPLAIGVGAQVGVGPDGLAVPRYAPGDLIYPQFELSTTGREVSTPFAVELRLRGASGRVLAETTSTERTPLPPQTVAIEITNTSLELPHSLTSGRYTLEVKVRSRGREVQRTFPLQVATTRVPLVRQLLGRGITLRGVVSGQPLFSERDAARGTTQGATGDNAFVTTLLGELAQSASAAAETLPEVQEGRFAGQSGGALFSSSGPQDVRDFLGFLLAVGAGTDALFADLYANWALEGAPAP